MLSVLLASSALAFGPSAVPLRSCQTLSSSSRTAVDSIQMINLFGNNEESSKRRQDLSLRSAPVGSRKVSFRKPNQATQGLQLGLKFRETFGKAVIIDAVIPGTEAARLEKDGKLSVGDEITMVSATFGSEMWSSRGVGKYRLEKSIAVRQGMTIDFVLEAKDDKSKAKMKKQLEEAKKQAEKVNRLQAQLTKEVEDENKKPKFLGLF